MKKLFLFILTSCFPFFMFGQEISTDTVSLTEEQWTALNQFYQDSVNDALTYQTGTIELEGNMATLVVPAGYKYLDATQSNYVLTELWGNPPSETLGLLFPENMGPLSQDFTYAIEISYSEEGYVDDEDAQDMDYEELLESMQSDIEAGNETRQAAGYGTIHLINWASAPFYDAEGKKLHWAKELQFDESPEHTLNYDIRILGRKGYISMNAIGKIAMLEQIKTDIPKFLGSVSFHEGHRYSDFNPDIDKIAAYGIGGLIAGKVLSKVGLLAVAVKFWKVIALAVVAAFGAFRKFIFGSKE